MIDLLHRETAALKGNCSRFMALELHWHPDMSSDLSVLGTSLSPRSISTPFGLSLFGQSSMSEASSESMVEARSLRRQRNLDQVEIPEDHVIITGDLLGKGGFGEVYLADYNGHNAAAKVWNVVLNDVKSCQQGVAKPSAPQKILENGRKCWKTTLEVASKCFTLRPHLSGLVDR